MKHKLSITLAVVLLASLILTVPAAASPPSPDGPVSTPPAKTVSDRPVHNKAKALDQPNIKDYLRVQQRRKLLAEGKVEEAKALTKAANDRVLVILVEFAGTDTFTWNPGDTWDPYGIADPNEAVYDADGNLIVGDCSNIITETKTFTYTGPLHNEMPRPVSAEDRSGDTIWTEDFSPNWFEAFMWGDGVVFDYVRQDGSVVHEDFTGKSVKDYFLDMSGGKYEIAGDVIGWLQVPHSTWWYGADECPGRRSPYDAGIASSGAIPGAGNARSFVRDALDAVNAAYPDFPWADYDLDGDGVIDRLWIVHSGYGEEDGTTLLNRTNYGEASLWSHSSGIPPYEVAPGIYAGPYIMMPENGGIGVFAHEYAHNLGADDLYAYGFGETSTGFWALQADDWTGWPIGFQPPAADPWHLDGWGWLDPFVVSDPSQEYIVTVGQASRFPGGEDVYRGVKIELPDGVLFLPVPIWQGDFYWWGGQENLANAMMTTAAPISIPPEGANLAFDLVYDIEDEWDFLWVQASTDGENWDTLTNANTQCVHDPNWIGGNYGFPEDLCGTGLGGFYGFNPSWPAPDVQEFDLSAYAGQDVYLRFWYMTDWGTLYSGPFIDNVTVASNGSTLFFDDAESGDANWIYEAPWERSSGTMSFSHNYYLQWRNVSETGGYDSALGDERWRFGPANTGLLVWYNNNFYSDNEIYNYLEDGYGFGPKGRMLVVDSHPMPYRDPDVAPNWLGKEHTNNTTRGLMRDAPFSQWDSVDFLYTDPYRADAQEHFYEGRPAVPAFHDSLGYYPGVANEGDGTYWSTIDWDASAAVPATAPYSIKAAPDYPGYHIQYIEGAGWYGFWGWWPPGSGNPGDDMAQYGWHVEILDQTDSTATLRIWNSMREFEGGLVQVPNTSPIVKGTTVEVNYQGQNIASMVDGFFLLPIDPDTEYVMGSAYGGATPLTAAYAAQLAAERDLKDLADLAADKAPDQVVAVAFMGPVGAGQMLDFGFSVVVTSMTGTVHHSMAMFDGGHFFQDVHSDMLPITDNSGYAVERSRRFDIIRDTFIDGLRPDSFFGTDQTMWIGFNETQRPVVYAQIDGIPADAAVDLAYLYVYVTEGRGYGAWPPSVINVSAHGITTPWIAEGVNWWTPWTNAGGDFGPALDTTHIGSGKVGTWVRFDITDWAEAVVRDRTSNMGLILTAGPDGPSRYGFATKEHWSGNVGYIRIYFRTAE